MMPLESQLPLALGGARATGFDDLIGLDAGVRLRLETIASGSRVCVTGPKGSGKTHLLMAISRHARQQQRATAYLSLKTAGAALVHVLPVHVGAGLVCVDHLDAVLGEPVAEEALFHFHNAMQDAGGSVVYALDKPVQETAIGLPDLRSRLAQCEQVVLRPLDDAGRAQMILQAARSRGMEMEDAAVQWMLKRFDRDAQSLMAAMEIIDARSLAAQRRVTIPFLRDVFPEQAGL